MGIGQERRRREKEGRNKRGECEKMDRANREGGEKEREVC